MELLLFSNSRDPNGGYLTHLIDPVAKLAGERRRALFIPFAGVTVDWKDYLAMVREALGATGLEILSIEDAGPADAQRAAIRQAELIVVGGGNTFRLAATCRERGLMDVIADAVRGGTPYVGWSAGANLACPTICTTNDMPIVDPHGFDALGLTGFQINPHYTNALPEGHHGETRDQRIMEFLAANPDLDVIGLPEGDWLEVAGDQVAPFGPFPAVRFRAGQEPEMLTQGVRF